MLRRQFTSGLVAAVASGGIARAAGPVAGRMVEVRGTRLYVEDTGPRDAPALLYLHGGPGSGAYDFSLFQGARLSRALRLIAFDQRGALRSGPLKPDETFGLNDLIEDAEALRRTLGIDRWTILGHSFGGFEAVCYAAAYRDSVEAVIFENPTFDLGSSARCLMRAAAAVYRRKGDPAGARRALAAAAAPTSQAKTWEAFGPITNNLGPDRDSLYVHGPDKAFFDRVVAESGLPGPTWGNGGPHQQRLYREGKVFEPVTGRLSQIRQPALLIHGRYDYVTAPDQVAAFRRRVKHGVVVTFENSSHFARVEEPDRYGQVVTDFVLAHARRGRRD